MELRYKRIMIMMTRRKSILELGGSGDSSDGGGGGTAGGNVVGYSGSFCKISVDTGLISKCHQQHRHQESENKNSFKVVVLLQSFLNLCYCLFLVPFRITKSSRGLYRVKTNLLQQIISTLLIITITVFSLLDLRHYQKQQNVRERPDQTFKYATIFLVHWIPVCWFIIFWMRRSRFSNLLLISQSKFLSSKEPQSGESDTITLIATGSGSRLPKGSRGCDEEAGGGGGGGCGGQHPPPPPTSSQLLSSQFKRWSLALKVCIFLTATKNTAFIFNEISQNNKASLSNYLDSVTERFLYDFGLEGTSLKHSPIILTIIGYVAAVIHFLMEFLIYLFDQLCLTAAAMVYATCQHFLDEFQMLVRRRRQSSSRRLNKSKPRGLISVPPPPPGSASTSKSKSPSSSSSGSGSGSQTRRKNNNLLDDNPNTEIFTNPCTNIEDSPLLDTESENSSRITHQCLRQISAIYLDLLAVLKGINSIFGPCVVLFFMYLYPLFIWSVFDTLQENTLLENLIRIHDMSVLCCVTVVAAEGSSKVEQFRQWLFQAAMTNLAGGDDIDNDNENDCSKRDQDNEQEWNGNGGSDNGEILLRFATMHREVSSEAVGLTGYKFFTVTYRFVATVAGLMTTYAIVMFQLQMMDPRKASLVNGTEQHLQQQQQITTSLLPQNFNVTMPMAMDIAD